VPDDGWWFSRRRRAPSVPTLSDTWGSMMKKRSSRSLAFAAIGGLVLLGSALIGSAPVGAANGHLGPRSVVTAGFLVASPHSHLQGLYLSPRSCPASAPGLPKPPPSGSPTPSSTACPMSASLTATRLSQRRSTPMPVVRPKARMRVIADDTPDVKEVPTTAELTAVS
jgi:hypothetical protein